MYLTEPLEKLLLLLVEQHDLHNGDEFYYIRLTAGAGLSYVGGGNVPVPNDDLDFEQLRSERLILFRREGSSQLRGKPTPLGIATARDLKQLKPTVTITGVPDQHAGSPESAKKPGRPQGILVDGQKLRAFRGKLSQPDFADKCGVSLATIQRGEAGSTWDDQTFEKVAETLSLLTRKHITSENLKK